jgi:hypothetical protein
LPRLLAVHLTEASPPLRLLRARRLRVDRVQQLLGDVISHLLLQAPLRVACVQNTFIFIFIFITTATTTQQHNNTHFYEAY